MLIEADLGLSLPMKVIEGCLAILWANAVLVRPHCMIVEG